MKNPEKLDSSKNFRKQGEDQEKSGEKSEKHRKTLENSGKFRKKIRTYQRIIE